MNWKKVIIKGAAISYGLLNLAVFVLLAALDGSLFHKPSEKAKRELAAGISSPNTSSLLRSVNL
jgi:hypothetical protein